MAMAARHHGHLVTYLAAVIASVLLAFALAPLAAGDPLGQFCGTSDNYTANSTYQANIQSLAATLPKTTSSSQMLFATPMLGAVPDIVYSLALCRGDANASACESCVAGAFVDAQQLCAYSKDVTIFYDFCLLRYSYKNFLPVINEGGGEFIILEPMRNVSASGNKYQAAVGSLSDGGSGFAPILLNTLNVSTPFKVFDAAVAVLINATADYAATNSSRSFGTAVEGFQTFDSQNPKLYGLAQCTPDLAPADCRSCLGGLIQAGPKYFSGKQGGRILGLRCNYRYEQYSFFTSSPLLQLPELAVEAPAPAPAVVNVTRPTTGGGQGTGRVLAIILPTIVMIVILVICCFLWRRKRKQAWMPSVEDSTNLEDIGNVDLLIIDLPTLRTTTENFV